VHAWLRPEGGLRIDDGKDRMSLIKVLGYYSSGHVCLKECAMLDAKMEEDFLFQWDLKELLKHEFESENWLVVYHQKKDERQNVGFFSALVPNAMVPSVLRNDSWDISIGDGGPEVCVSIEDGEDVWEYHNYTEKGSIQPIVIARFFHNIRPSYIEIQEEFRLFHNLF
jgi:hypothetical protein